VTARRAWPGAPPELARALNAAVDEIERAALQARPPQRPVVTADFLANPGEMAIVEASTVGLTCVLPAPIARLREQRVTILSRTTGPVRLMCIDGVVNGLASLTVSAIGAFELVCDGSLGWRTVGLASGGGGAPDTATYHLAVADALLPNARVAAGSGSISVNNATPGFVSWVWLGFSLIENNVPQGLVTAVSFDDGFHTVAHAADLFGVGAVSFDWTGISITDGVTPIMSDATELEFDDSPSILLGAVDLGGGVVSIAARRAALTGFAVAALDGNVTTSAEPIVTFGASANMTNERVLTAGAGTTVNVATAGQIKIDVSFPATPTWAQVLAAGRFTGAFNPHVDASQFVGFGNSGALPASGDIRHSGTLTLNAATDVTIIGQGDVNLIATDDNVSLSALGATGDIVAQATTTILGIAGAGNVQWTATLGDVNLTAGDDVNIVAADALTVTTGGVNRFNLEPDGSWSLAGDNGDSRDFMMSTSASTPPIWQPLENTSEIVNAAATGNLGTINIAALTCGGTYRVSAASSNFSIEGFTAKPQGFWFNFIVEDISDLCTLFNEDVTATATDRIRTPGEIDISAVQELRGILVYGGSRWSWVSANPHSMGNAVSNISCFTGTSGIAVTSFGNTAFTMGAADQFLISGAVNFQVATLSFTAGAFVQGERNAGIVPAAAAGQGVWWNENTTPNRPMFRDDQGTDWLLGFSASGALAARTTTSASTTPAVIATMTIAASGTGAGSVYEFEAHIQVTRGSTATATTILLEFRVGGTQLLAVSKLLNVTNPYAGAARIKGEFTVFAAPGAAAAVAVTGITIDTIISATVDTRLPNASITTAAATNGALVCDVRASMSAATANVTFTPLMGFIRRVR